MKVLVFHQPWPMGNYKLNVAVADKLQADGHEVHALEQLNATTISEIYENNVSGSKPKFDLSYSGYNQNPDKPDHLYDLND